MDLQIIAEEANETHFDKLNTLNTTFYDENHSILNTKYLEWLYILNPAGKATLIIVEEDEAYIGVMALIPVELTSNGQIQKACYAVNVLSHPEHRKKNLFIKMIRFTKEYLAEKNIWLLGHPNKNAIPGWKRQKMKFRDSLCPYLCKPKLPFSSLKSTRIKTIDQLNQLPSTFWSMINTNGTVDIKNSPEFISWRYLDSVAVKYKVNLISKGDIPIGINVCRAYKGPVNLMVHYFSKHELLNDVIKVSSPTILMSPNESIYNNALWKLPIKGKDIPFFLTNWLENEDIVDTSLLTLAVSDL